MLRCPKCSRTYETDSQKFCTHDGGRLVPVEEKPSNFDPNATVHGNFAQFKEMGAMPGGPSTPPVASPSSVEPPPVPARPIDLNKTVMSQPPPVEPSAPTISDLAPTSQDLPPAPVDAGPVSEELGEFETQWAMPRDQAVASDLASAESWGQAPAEPPPPAREEPVVVTEPPAYEPEQSFATQISMPVPDPTPLEPPVAPAPVPPAPEVPAVGPSANQYASAAQASKLAAMVAVTPPKKNRRLGLIFAIVAILFLFFLAAVGILGYLYWSSQQNKAGNRNSNLANANANTNGGDSTNKNTNTNVGGPANTNTNTNTNTSPPPVPAGQLTFTNDKFGLTGPVADHFVDFSFNYPKAWELNPAATGSGNFVDLTSKNGDKLPVEKIVVSFYESAGSVAMDRTSYDKRIAEKSAQFATQISNYQKVSEGETTLNNIPAYEFRFQGKSSGKNAFEMWGRMIFIPPNHTGDTNGITLVMYATSLSSEVRSLDEVGVKGDLPVILNSFRFGH